MARGVCCAKSTSGFNRNGSSYGPCATSYYCKKNGKCYWDKNVRDVAAIANGVIPQLVYNSVRNHNKKKLLKTIQSSKPQIYFWTYNFYQALKFAYNLCGRNKTGCCYRMLWKPHDSTYKILKFGDKVDLYRYLIRTPSSDLNWFIKTVLKSLQSMNLAKHMISNSKYYPYQNLVKSQGDLRVRISKGKENKRIN